MRTTPGTVEGEDSSASLHVNKIRAGGNTRRDSRGNGGDTPEARSPSRRPGSSSSGGSDAIAKGTAAATPRKRDHLLGVPVAAAAVATAAAVHSGQKSQPFEVPQVPKSSYRYGRRGLLACRYVIMSRFVRSSVPPPIPRFFSALDSKTTTITTERQK